MYIINKILDYLYIKILSIKYIIYAFDTISRHGHK